MSEHLAKYMPPDWTERCPHIVLFDLYFFVCFFLSNQRLSSSFYPFPYIYSALTVFFGRSQCRNLNIKNTFVYDGQIKCNNFFLVFTFVMFKHKRRTKMKRRKHFLLSLFIVLYPTYTIHPYAHPYVASFYVFSIREIHFIQIHFRLIHTSLRSVVLLLFCSWFL